MDGEIEERHEFLGQPGKLKVTGFLSRGRAGNFQDAVNIASWTGMDPSLALALDRKFRNRPGVSVNLEQQINESVGFFARAGYTDGSVEPWDFADIDRTVQAGLSISGKDWGRPDDTIGFAGIINGLANSHEAYFAAGGLGILIGDGSLPAYGLEKILESFLQLCSDAQHQARRRLSAHRRPRLQRDARSRECHRGAHPLAVLTRRRQARELRSS